MFLCSRYSCITYVLVRRTFSLFCMGRISATDYVFVLTLSSKAFGKKLNKFNLLFSNKQKFNKLCNWWISIAGLDKSIQYIFYKTNFICLWSLLYISKIYTTILEVRYLQSNLFQSKITTWLNNTNLLSYQFKPRWPDAGFPTPV